MKHGLTLLLPCLVFWAACATRTTKAVMPSDLYQQMADPHAPYDSALATRLGADQYGMHQYVMAFLKAGPNRSQDSFTAANLQKAHLQNITRMAEAGKLVVAGPFLDGGEIKGIYIFI